MFFKFQYQVLSFIRLLIILFCIFKKKTLSLSLSLKFHLTVIKLSVFLVFDNRKSDLKVKIWKCTSHTPVEIFNLED